MSDSRSPHGSQVWRKIPYDVGDTDVHFRLSDALVRLSDRPTLWWHSTERPTLVLGAGQTDFDLARCHASGILTVRRHAGGTAVYAEAGVLGLDVMLPSGHPLAPSDVLETYRWLGRIWNGTLIGLGLPTRVVSVEEARRTGALIGANAPVRVACFGTISPYEVAVANRKLVGLAQVRRRNGVLLQSAIHRHFDADRLASLLGIDAGEDRSELRRAAVGLDELGDVTIQQVMDAFERTLESELAVRIVEGSWSTKERAHLDEGAGAGDA